jgi:hypothetical protein
VAVAGAPLATVSLTVADAVGPCGAAQESVYGAGAETATGLDTTRTAAPLDGSHSGVMVSGWAGSVPGRVNVMVAEGVTRPSDSDQ